MSSIPRTSSISFTPPLATPNAGPSSWDALIDAGDRTVVRMPGYNNNCGFYSILSGQNQNFRNYLENTSSYSFDQTLSQTLEKVYSSLQNAVETGTSLPEDLQLIYEILRDNNPKDGGITDFTAAYELFEEILGREDNKQPLAPEEETSSASSSDGLPEPSLENSSNTNDLRKEIEKQFEASEIDFEIQKKVQELRKFADCTSDNQLGTEAMPKLASHIGQPIVLFTSETSISSSTHSKNITQLPSIEIFLPSQGEEVIISQTQLNQKWEDFCQSNTYLPSSLEDILPPSMDKSSTVFDVIREILKNTHTIGILHNGYDHYDAVCSKNLQ